MLCTKSAKILVNPAFTAKFLHCTVIKTNDFSGHMVALDITEQTGNGNVTVIYADFEKLETVKRCTELVHKNFDKIDILINNAGV